jgi:hypothetical protein
MIGKEKLLTLERPQPVCAECGAALEALERNPTRLTVKEDEPRRADFCPDCWRFAKEEARQAYWQTKREKKEKRAPRLSRREKAVAVRALFEGLWEQRDREAVDAHLYFLAHLLLRWGGLKWVRNEADEGGREVIVFEHPTTGDVLEIPAVDAEEEAIAAIQTRIEDFLRDYAPEAEATLA